MDRDGNLRGSHSERAESVAVKNSLTNLALIHNVIGGNFNKEEVSALLNSKSARSNAVSNIVKLLDANGYDGVNIDFENILDRSRSADSLHAGTVQDAQPQRLQGHDLNARKEQGPQPRPHGPERSITTK